MYRFIITCFVIRMRCDVKTKKEKSLRNSWFIFFYRGK